MSRTNEVSTEVLFRPAEPGDLHYVLKTWIRSFKSSPYAGPYTNSRLVTAIKATVVDCMARGTVTVACSRRSPKVIYGFTCYETDRGYPLVHYVYVKGIFRSMGIGRSLLSIAMGSREGRPRYTHRTTHRHARVLARDVGAQFAPSLCRNPRKESTDEEAQSPVELGAGGAPAARE